jgi:peptidoglycan/LPS O-acetylase OafA/YrhL
MYVFHWYDNVETPLITSWYSKFQQNMVELLYMHLPDLLALSIGLTLSFTANLNDHKSSNAVEMFSLPLLSLALMVVGTIQTGTASKNLSRMLLSSLPFTILGYCSYSLYLFQRIFLEDFLSRILVSYHLHQNYYGFQTFPLWLRILMMLFVIAFCWLSQRFYADPIAAYVYPRLRKYCFIPHIDHGSAYAKISHSFR